MIFKNQDAAFTIIDYLQFQDITAQQISGVYALLSDTEKPLYVSNLLKEFDFGEEGPEIVLPEIDPKSFNANAIFIDKGNIQNLIDDLFETGDTDIDIPNDHNDIELKICKQASLIVRMILILMLYLMITILVIKHRKTT